MPVYRIKNVSNIQTGGRGHFLDLGVELGGKHIAVGKSIDLTAESPQHLPECIQNWADKNWIRVIDVSNPEGPVISGLGVGGELTPSSINPISEANDDMFDEDIDLTNAQEARIPEQTKPIMGDINQMSKTKVSEAMAEERVSTDVSPLPGEKPREIDNASQFSVKAPRSNQPGGVISRNK